MKKTVLVLFIILIWQQAFALQLEVKYSDSWDTQELKITEQEFDQLRLNYSINEFQFQEIMIDNENLTNVILPGVFLPNDEGMPNLPGLGRYIAIPQNARAELNILDYRIERFQDVEIAPAPRIPLDTETGPLQYNRNNEVYNSNRFYPQSFIQLSEPSKLRGVDVVVVGITPFQYNPVTKELIVYRDISFEINFSGGSGYYGEDRLRSRWWEPILQDAILNSSVLPVIDFNRRENNRDGAEYLIICPNDATFLAWADSIKTFRQQQGISTLVVTTTEVGGNTATAIETYVDNAYNNWSTPPAAVLLLGDYGTSGNTIISHLYSHPGGYPNFASDNRFADVSGNDLPDIVFARITANNAEQLQVMISKFLDYERNPPTDTNFYNNPITALGWQTERWFQICSEVVGGYFLYEHGKSPVRINAIYSGTPGTTWSTATNTNTVVNYFGPSGLGYIPATPAELGGWSGGTAADVVNAINSGSFLLQHRDHGSYTGWGEPDFQSSNINSLTNTGNKLPFIFSINCQTGAFHRSTECFTEKFHRYTFNGQNSGALGLTAATEVSYSFVNDTFVWGLFDNMWPDFMPDYGTTPDSRGVLPAFGNAAGKHFLYQSSWPYNTSNKQITYRLFHHHGDAFLTLFSEVPQNLTVTHASTILAGAATFSVTADNGSFIALTVNGNIIATADGTGSPVSISIPAQNSGAVVRVTVTKQNYYRYEADVDVIVASGPYVSYESHQINDILGNNNGLADYNEDILLSVSLQNVGPDPAYSVNAVLSTGDSYVIITDNSQSFGTIAAGATVSQSDAYLFSIADDIPDQHTVNFDLEITGTSDETWNSSFSIVVNAPDIAAGSITIDDFATGNGNGRLDPGETVNLIISNSNQGHSTSPEATAYLSSISSYVILNNSSFSVGTINAGSSVNAVFSVSVSPATPLGTSIEFQYQINAGSYDDQNSYIEIAGQIPVAIIDLDSTPNSGAAMQTALNSLGIANDYYTAFPADLDIYTSLFVCLGIYANNHVLSAAEGQLLADYLNSGGNLYMEGGDTWYYDSQTAVHSMFNINPVSDGSGDLATINGITGTFTNSMSFSYSGENNWIDRISAIAPAENIFANSSPAYYCAVSYDQGSYRTIGSSFEFGGLTDSSVPSTKQSLMNEFINFFGLGATPTPPVFSLSPLSLDYGSVNVGDSSTLSFTIANNGGSILTGSITTPADFAVEAADSRMSRNTEQQISYSVDPLQSRIFDLTFTPSAAGSYNDNVIISSNDPNHPANSLNVLANAVLPPEITVAPEFFNLSLMPGQIVNQSMTISNLGTADLNFSIAVEQPSSRSGNIELEHPHNLSAEIKPDLFLEEQNRLITDYNELPPQNAGRGEEIFGSWDGGTWIGSLRDRGNIYLADTDVTITETRFYLNIPTSTQLYFFVYEGSSLTGTYTRVSEVHIAQSGSGEGWYSSGMINLAISAGNYYYIGASWEGNATYGRGIETTPLTTSFGTLETGVPSDLAGYPPAETCSNTSSGFAPYYQTIVTSDQSFWLTAAPQSGTISGSAAQEITCTFDATELEEGLYNANFVISSNDPDQPLINVPATLNVSASDPGISVAPGSLIFGEVEIGASITLMFSIENTGTGLLMGEITTSEGYSVSELSDSFPAFYDQQKYPDLTENVLNYYISGGTSQTFYLTFAPDRIQSYNSYVNISHNVSSANEYIIVYGDGVATPEPNISIDQSSMSNTLQPDYSIIEPLIVSNNGNQTLNYSVNVVYNDDSRSIAYVYPQSLDYWTGSCTSAAKTDVSEVRGYDTEDGWMKFDLSSIPNNAVINSVTLHGYVNYTYWPYWSITPVSLDPVTANAADLNADIIAEQESGYYLYQNESSTFEVGWKEYALGGSVNADLQAALIQDWFAIGIASRDDNTTYYLNFDGWNETNVPYLEINYTVNQLYSWLSVENSSSYAGSIAGNAQETLEIEFNADGLTDDIYSGELTFFSNDPHNSVISIPVTLTVDSSTTPIISINPEMIDITLTPGNNADQFISISNSGLAELVYSTVINYGSDHQHEIVTTKRFKRVDQTTADTNAELVSLPEPGRAAGDILIDFDVETPSGDNTCLGSDFDGSYVWVTGSNDDVSNQLYKFDTSGNLLNTYQQGTSSSWGMRDLAFDGTYLYSGDENGFYRIDPANGAVTTLFSGNLGLTCIRALAYDDENDYFYACNWDTGIVVFTAAGTILNTLTNPGLTGIYGLAFENGRLWFFDRSGSPETTFYEYDISSQTLTGISYQVPLLSGLIGQMNGGAFFSNTIVPGKTVLGGLVQGDPVDRFFAMEVAEIQSWLTITNNGSGTVASHGGSTEMTLHFDAADLSLGSHSAVLYITSNDPVNPNLPVNISLNVAGKLAAPHNVSITIDNDNVVLSWAIVPGASIYRVYRSSENDDNFILLGDTIMNSFVDTGASTEDHYYYFITAE